MRIFAYIRVDPNSGEKFIYDESFYNIGFEIPQHRLIVEEVLVSVSVRNRDKFISLITYSLESEDVLVVKGLDCLGGSFIEIYNVFCMLENKRIRLICLDFSKNEIQGDVRLIFLHFVKLSSEFERVISNDNVYSNSKKIGRPEVLSKNQQSEVLEKFKRGQSVYSLANEYSVTRPVIQRLLNKASAYIG